MFMTDPFLLAAISFLSDRLVVPGLVIVIAVIFAGFLIIHGIVKIAVILFLVIRIRIRSDRFRFLFLCQLEEEECSASAEDE